MHLTCVYFNLDNICAMHKFTKNKLFINLQFSVNQNSRIDYYNSKKNKDNQSSPEK